MNILTFKVVRLLLLFVTPLLSGCASNHTHPNFESRLSGMEKITGFIVKLESTGLERGGLKHVQLSDDETVIFIAMRSMQKLFTEQQLQKMKASPTLHLQAELIGLGYEEGEVKRDTKLLAGLLASVIRNPRQPVRVDELKAVRRLASRSAGDFILLGDISIRRHISEKSRSLADFLSILAAAGGQYGVPGGQDTANSRWAIVDPVDGGVLRVLEEHLRVP